MARTADPKLFNKRTQLLHRPTESSSCSEPDPHYEPGRTRQVDSEVTDPENTHSGAAGLSNEAPQKDEAARNQQQPTPSESKAHSVLQDLENAKQHQNHPKAPKTFRPMRTMLVGPSTKPIG